MLARSLGLLWAGAPFVALAWLLVPGTHQHAPLAGALLCLAVPWATAALLLSGRLDHAPPAAFQALLAVATIVATPGVAWTHDLGPSFALFYVWSTPYAFCWFSLRHAFAQTALVAACYLTVLELSDHTRDEPLGAHLSSVLLVAATIVAIGIVARRLVHDMRRREQLRTERQRALAEFGRRSLDATDLQDVLDQALRVAAVRLGADYAAIAEVVDSDLRIMSVAGPQEAPRMAVGTRVPMGRASAIGYALQTGEPFLADDLDADPRLELDPEIRAIGSRSVIAVKISDPAGEALGGMAVYAPQPARFSEDDALFVQALANVIAAAIGRFAAEQLLREQATHDPLTGLPNRKLFADRLDQALRRARRTPGTFVAAMVIDLNRFKAVNDSLGHLAGDELLIGLSERLSDTIRAGDTLARLGGDEFVVVVEGVRGPEHALEIADRVTRAWSEPFMVAERPLRVQASTGVALSDGTDTADDLLSNADTAMYRGKQAGSTTVELFDDRLRHRTRRTLKMERELRDALDSGRLIAHFQPIVDLCDGRCVGLEALARWQHPTQGLLGADRFVELAEDSGLMVPLGERVLDLALGQVAAWRRAGHERLWVSVDVSPRQLQVREFVEGVVGRLAAHRLPPDALMLELTEHAMLDPRTPPVGALLALELIGVRVALDDFGTGFSSLSSLRTLPVSSLKIDRSFVADVATDAANRGIVSGVLQMARGAGLTVIAEGVETVEEMEALRELECDRAQGRHLARPLTPDEATAYLGDRRTALAPR